MFQIDLVRDDCAISRLCVPVDSHSSWKSEKEAEHVSGDKRRMVDVLARRGSAKRVSGTHRRMMDVSAERAAKSGDTNTHLFETAQLRYSSLENAKGFAGVQLTGQWNKTMPFHVRFVTRSRSTGRYGKILYNRESDCFPTEHADLSKRESRTKVSNAHAKTVEHKTCAQTGKLTRKHSKKEATRIRCFPSSTAVPTRTWLLDQVIENYGGFRLTTARSVSSGHFAFAHATPFAIPISDCNKIWGVRSARVGAVLLQIETRTISSKWRSPLSALQIAGAWFLKPSDANSFHHSSKRILHRNRQPTGNVP